MGAKPMATEIPKTDMDWLRIERRFSAPIEAVWRMWTEGNQFEKWYGPNGMSVTVTEMSAHIGGCRMFRMEMKRPDRTMTMWFTGEFKEVRAPNRLVYTESMCDEKGNILSPQSMGMPEGHPEVTEVIIDLVQDGDGTIMKLTHVGVPADSQGAGGWAQAIEKLADVLAKGA